VPHQKRKRQAPLADWRRSVSSFAQYLSPLLGAPWVPYRWLEFLSGKLQGLVGRRIIVCAPPRHGKSEMISRWLPAWFLSACPERHVLLTSYEAAVAASWGRKVRDVMALEEVGVPLRRDVRAANRWMTPQGGGMMTAGAGGPLTGSGGNLIVVDDPIKNAQDAESPTMRRHVWDWFRSVVLTRAEPESAIVVDMARWNSDDLVGRILAEQADQWEVISLPAIAEPGDPMGRDPGEPLCPERFPLEALRAQETIVGPFVWKALFQQSPMKSRGQIFELAWFKHWDPASLPSSWDECIGSWDLAFKDALTSSYVVGEVWGRRGGDCYLLDQVRAHMAFPVTLKAIAELAQKWPGARPILVEDKANGPAVLSVLQRQIPGIIPAPVSGSKAARAQAVSPFFASGNVWIPPYSHASWVADYVHELTNFTGADGEVNDQVDTTSQALLRLDPMRKRSIGGLVFPDMSQTNQWG
jgi:predicted phage terminase large subunit-like protein